MKKILKLLKSKVGSIIFSLLVGTYIFGMFLIPFFKGGGSWSYLQEVWRSWQALNVGILASISTFLIYNATVYSEKNKRRREFETEKPFLPKVLMELDSYCKNTSTYIRSMLKYLDSSDEEKQVIFSPPPLPAEYGDVFRRCIYTGEAHVANHITGILIRLQIFNEKLQKTHSELFAGGNLSIKKMSFKERIIEISEIYSLIKHLLEFSISSVDFRANEYDLEIIHKAFVDLGFSAFGIGEGEYELIERFKKRGGIISAVQ